MKKNNSYKNFSYITIGRFVAIALQAIFYLLFAALLEPEEYGQLNYIVALAGSIALISRFGLNYTVTVYQSKNNILTEQVNILAAITTLAAAVILLPLNIFASLLLVGLSFFTMNQYNLLGMKKYKTHMLNAITKNALFFILPLGLYFILDIHGIVIGMAISNLIASSHFLKSLKLKTFTGLKENYKVLIHNFGVDASTNLARRVDKLLIAPLFGFFLVGIYQFNMQILFALEILPFVLQSFLLSEESSGAKNTKLSYLVVLGSIVFAIIAFFFSPFVVTEFFPKYSEGIFSLQILVFTIIPLTVSSIFSAKLLAKESTTIGYSAPS